MQFGFVLSFNQGNLECGSDLENLKDFTRIESDVYQELECLHSMIFGGMIRRLARRAADLATSWKS
jgi:hypothetical protein